MHDPIAADHGNEPIHHCGKVDPEPYTLLRLYFPDASSTTGVWTGKIYWAQGQQVFPDRWQLSPRADAVTARGDPE